MTDREDLWRAAQILRERASAATSGPWLTGPNCWGLKDVNTPDGKHVFGGDWPVAKAADAEWASLMNPLLGEHLAEWLEVVANRRHKSRTPHSRGILGGSYGYCTCGDPVVAPDNEEVRCDRLRQAVNVARIILNANAALEAS